jgi:hypothetical protein
MPRSPGGTTSLAFKRGRLVRRGGRSLYGASGPLVDADPAAVFTTRHSNIYRVRSWFPEWEQAQGFAPPRLEASFRVINMISTRLRALCVRQASNSYVNVDYEIGRPETQRTSAGSRASSVDRLRPRGLLHATTRCGSARIGTRLRPSWLTNSTIDALWYGEQLPVFAPLRLASNTVYPNNWPKSWAVWRRATSGCRHRRRARRAAMPGPLTRSIRSRPPAARTPSVVNRSLRLFAAWRAIANLPAGTARLTPTRWRSGSGPGSAVRMAWPDRHQGAAREYEFAIHLTKTYVAPRLTTAPTATQPPFHVQEAQPAQDRLL